MTTHTHGRTMPANRPRKPKGGGLLFPATRQPETLEALLRLRREAQEEIDRLIALIDRIDGDADLEATGDDEPSLGWLEAGARYGLHKGGTDDREDECEDEGAQCDDEGDLEQDTSSGVDEPPDWKRTAGPTRWHIDPSLMPAEYFMKGEGNCLDPVVQDGDRMLIRKEAVKPGDLVVIYFTRKATPRGAHQALVKRLVADGRHGSAKLADGRPCVLAEMFNPPKLLAFPAETVMAIHRVARVDNESPSFKLSQGEMLAEAAKRRFAPTVG